ncbi:MAG TPA: hypothetical protein VD973_09405 [Symbiobacteriaceae bacterium]|nr:hypothetical protein [Symbiobacteriaceae bacterium]
MTILSPIGEWLLVMLVIVLLLHTQNLSHRISALEHKRGRRNRR